jgi:5'-nucleotidase (lipoprotein e(P4) family)
MPHFRTLSSRILSLTLVLSAGACRSGATMAPPATGQAPAAAPVNSAPAVPANIRWVRASAEHRALYLQIYSGAATELERAAAGRAAGKWGVIMDVDETILDNSLFEQEQAENGRSYSDSSWAAWVRREAAPALPGAVAFTQRVHALGGRVALVTGRADALCPETRANLQRVGIVFDEALCQTTSASDKNPRFQAIEEGRTPSTLAAFEVLMWVGDNIQDFPGLTQAIRSGQDGAFTPFGHRFILLPDPLYGSWEKNPLP